MASEDLFQQLQLIKDKVAEVEKARMKRLVDIDAAEARLKSALEELESVYGVTSVTEAKKLLKSKQAEAEDALEDLRGIL